MEHMELSNLNVWNNLKIETFASPLSGPHLGRPSQVKQSGNIFLRNIVLRGGFCTLVVHAFGGPQPVIQRPYYKWPKIRWISLGLFHPPYRSDFTPFITGSGDHQLWVGGVFGPKFVETSPFFGQKDFRKSGFEIWTDMWVFPKIGVGPQNGWWE